MQRVHRVAGAAGTAVLMAVSGVAVATELRGDGLDSADLWAAGEAGGDGLNRFVVSVPDAAQPGPASAPEPAAATAAEAEAAGGDPAAPHAAARGPRHRVDVELLLAAQDELGTDGRVEAGTDGSLRYVLGPRSRVVSAGGAPPAADRASAAPPPASEGDDAPPAPAEGDAAAPPPDVTSGVAGSPREPGDAAVAALAAVPGIDSAQRLSDGRVLVATRLDARAVGALDGVRQVAESVSLPVAGATPSSLPTDPLVGHAWFLRNAAAPGVDTGALAVWPASRGEGAIVAIVDTGFSRSHPDLAGSVWQNPAEPCGGVDTDGNGKAGDCNGWNFYRNSPDVDNGAGGWHGTAVAGAAGARADNGHGAAGIAPGVRLMPLVVGTEGSVDMVLAAEAVRYAADHGADVINLSFGGPASGWVVDHLRAAIRYAGQRGSVVVAAAGNDGANRDATAPVYPASYDEPGMLTVGSSTRTETVAAHSAYGAVSVDLFAPGESIVAPARADQYSLWNGTSLASPLVAGAVALHAAVDPAASPALLVRAVLADTARHPAYAGRSVSGGRLSLTALGERASGVGYSFTGAGQQSVGTVRPTVTLRGRAPDGALSVRLALGMRVGDEVLAVSDADLRAGGVGSVTDDDGQVTVGLDRTGLATGVPVPMSLDLPTGQYVLLAQALVDGRPVTRPHVAPLTVVAAPPGAAGPTPEATGSAPAPTAAPGPAPTAPGPAPTAAGPVGPGAPGGPGGSGGSGGGPGGGALPPGSPAPPPPSPAPVPGAPPAEGRAPGAPAPTTAAAPAPAPTAGPAPAVPPPAGPAPSATSGPGPAGPSQPTVTPAPLPGGPRERRFDGSDPYAITVLSPDRVSTAGGQLVTVEGRALPADPRVRVGTSGVADIWATTSTRLTFVAPPRVAGRYDVMVSAPGGRVTVLAAVLEYVAPEGGPGGAAPAPAPGGSGAPGGPGAASPPAGPPAPPAPGPTSSPPDPDAGGPGPGGSAPGNPGPGGPAPGGPAPGDPAPGSPAPGGGGPGDPGTAAPTRQVVAGPGGLRLVRGPATFAGVTASLWDRSGCDTGCPGVAL